MGKICFTGRRPKDLCGYNQTGYNTFVGSLARWLQQFINMTGTEQTVFISGGAQGFDQLAFWAVDLLKNAMPEPVKSSIVNTVYVPFKGQSRIWKETGLFSRQQYDQMVAKADRVAYLQDTITDRSEIVKALLSRNHMMVDSADTVIALYPDNTWTTANGGTAECMRYAEAQEKKIIQIKYSVENGMLTGSFPQI